MSASIASIVAVSGSSRTSPENTALSAIGSSRMKAGRWVFANGLMAQDFVNGIAPDVLATRLPHGGRPKREKEALRIYENLDAVLRAT